jgi:hypothetical protein
MKFETHVAYIDMCFTPGASAGVAAGTGGRLDWWIDGRQQPGVDVVDREGKGVCFCVGSECGGATFELMDVEDDTAPVPSLPEFTTREAARKEWLEQGGGECPQSESGATPAATSDGISLTIAECGGETLSVTVPRGGRVGDVKDAIAQVRNTREMARALPRITHATPPTMQRN